MGTLIVTAISNIAGAFKGVFAWATGRQTLKNTATMQANAAAKTDQQIKDQAAADVASGNAAKIEDDIAP